MARKSRTTNKNNIVIVCEGTDTEVRYFTDLKEYVERNFPERFSDIRIVPTAEELVVITNRNKNKKLKNNTSWAYYIQEEDNEDDFIKYRAQPIRYVREAELFKINDGYSEAWAVYDHDNFPAHEAAKSHAETVDVKIAFSAISFEEWILIHFERNNTGFGRSICKQNKQDIMCGTGAHINDCHGIKCVGGRIRDQKYIPNYGKSMNGLFNQLFDRHMVAIANAAWLKSLYPNSDNYWSCNPFTTVDKLISRLLGYNQTFSWISNPENFVLYSTVLKISGHTVKNIGNNAVVIKYKIYDNRMEVIGEYDTGVIFPNELIQLHVPAQGYFVGIADDRDINIMII